MFSTFAYGQMGYVIGFDGLHVVLLRNCGHIELVVIHDVVASCGDYEQRFREEIGC